jgi:hypothetical protein
MFQAFSRKRPYRPAAHSNDTPEDSINPSTTSLKTAGLIRTTISRAENDPIISAVPVIKPSITTCKGNAPKCLKTATLVP